MAMNRALWNRGVTYSTPFVHNTRQVASRTFSSCAVRQLNPLLNLSAFSGSKEAQYLSKERRIPRTEFAPHLELIRSSEVDPFAPTAGASPTVIAALRRAQTGESDKDTAYTLAISNLIKQLEASKQELREAKQSLGRLQQKYEKNGQEGLVLVLLTAGIIVWVTYNTDVIGEVKDFFKRNNVTVKFLHVEHQPNTIPTGSVKSSEPRLLELQQQQPEPSRLNNSRLPETTRTKLPITKSQTLQLEQPTVSHTSFLSRIFWAPSSRT